MIREAVTEDYLDICKICREDLGYECDPELTKSRLKNLDGQREKVFVAVDNGIVAGYVHAEKYNCLYWESAVNILGLAVSGESRRKGFGRALMKAAEDWALENDIKIIRLNSGVGRKDAHKFYRKAGYGNEKEQIRFLKKLP